MDQPSAHAEGFSLASITDFFSSDKKDDEKAAAPVSDEEEEEEEHDPNAGPDVSDLPTIALDDVRTHNTADDIWVTFEGVVYDVTSFVEHHPGGKEL